MEQKIHQLVEDKIIDLINQKSGGRLVIIKPENLQADLAVEERGNYYKKMVFLKIFVQDRIFENKDFVKQKMSETHAQQDDLYFVFANFDIVSQDIEGQIWFMPSQTFEKENFSKFLIDQNEIGRILLSKFAKQV